LLLAKELETKLEAKHFAVRCNLQLSARHEKAWWKCCFCLL